VDPELDEGFVDYQVLHLCHDTLLCVLLLQVALVQTKSVDLQARELLDLAQHAQVTVIKAIELQVELDVLKGRDKSDEAIYALGSGVGL